MSWLQCRDTISCCTLAGSTLACGLQNGEVQVWSLLTRRLLGVTTDHKSPVTCLALVTVQHHMLVSVDTPGLTEE